MWTATARPGQQKVAVPLGQIAPRRIERDAAGARRLPQDAPAAFVTRLGPRVERPLRQAFLSVPYDERLVVLEHRPESVAPRTRTARVVVGKQDLRQGGGWRGAVRACRGVGEAAAVPVLERPPHAPALG